MFYLPNFITLFLSLIIESMPFVTLGVIVSVLVAIFIPNNFVTKLPTNPIVVNLIISTLGIFFPVCQCGNIPVSRRLILNNFRPSQAMVFLLAAPIVNPVTFITTWEAFPSMHSIAIIRIVVAILLANIIGYVMSRTGNENSFLNKQFYEYCSTVDNTPKKSLKYALDLFQTEFITVVKILCIGALVAAAVQTIVPQETITTIGHNIFLAVIAMMLLGFILSICSTVDAFFALAFINIFPLGAIFSFLLFGPLVDIKMVIMMRSIYTVKTITIVSLAIFVISFIIGVAWIKII